jgi:hypothetical protein
MIASDEEGVDRSELGELLNLIDYVRSRLNRAIEQLPPQSDKRRLRELVQRETLLLTENTKEVRRWTEE